MHSITIKTSVTLDKQSLLFVRIKFEILVGCDTKQPHCFKHENGKQLEDAVHTLFTRIHFISQLIGEFYLKNQSLI